MAASCIPYPSLRRHGIVGDRRTAALIAADGTVDWLCLPDYDGAVLLGALLDARHGGLWRMGPARLMQGEQRYLDDSAVLTTAWRLDEGELELCDAMLWPDDDRPAGQRARRVLLRRLRCTSGAVPCAAIYRPRRAGALSASDVAPPAVAPPWTSRPMNEAEGQSQFVLRAGEELWAVLDAGGSDAWSVDSCRAALDQVAAYWRKFTARLTHEGPRRPQVLRAAITIHLLAYAPQGSSVAAVTTSVPERIGGTWNADYRLSWVRDASLSATALTSLGDIQSADRYLAWLKRIVVGGGSPAQPLYTIRGEREPQQRSQPGWSGYRGSTPILFGNHAFQQTQTGSVGFLAECVWQYVRHGGDLSADAFHMLLAAAAHVEGRWDQPDNSLWELPTRQHYVSSRVMSWVTLDRAIRVARHLDRAAPIARWGALMDTIRDEVVARGWSERLGSFRQRYDGDDLDASALLIPLFGLLPFEDPRVARTIDRIREDLTIDGLVYRFLPEAVPGVDASHPLGEFEGAFLPCTLWLSTALARLGRRRDAERVLDQVDRLTGPLGLLPEALDPRDGDFRGNSPLLFSHAEYLRATQALVGSDR